MTMQYTALPGTWAPRYVPEPTSAHINFVPRLTWLASSSTGAAVSSTPDSLQPVPTPSRHLLHLPTYHTLHHYLCSLDTSCGPHVLMYCTFILNVVLYPPTFRSASTHRSHLWCPCLGSPVSLPPRLGLAPSTFGRFVRAPLRSPCLVPGVSWSGARSCVGAGVGASDEAPSPLPSLDRGPSVHVTLRELGACEVAWLSREPRPGWRGLGSSRIHRCFTLEPPLSEAPPSCGAFPGLSIHLFTAPIRPRVPEIYARSCLAHTSRGGAWPAARSRQLGHPESPPGWLSIFRGPVIYDERYRGPWFAHSVVLLWRSGPRFVDIYGSGGGSRSSGQLDLAASFIIVFPLRAELSSCIDRLCFISRFSETSLEEISEACSRWTVAASSSPHSLASVPGSVQHSIP